MYHKEVDKSFKLKHPFGLNKCLQFGNISNFRKHIETLLRLGCYCKNIDSCSEARQHEQMKLAQQYTSEQLCKRNSLEVTIFVTKQVNRMDGKISVQDTAIWILN